MNTNGAILTTMLIISLNSSYNAGPSSSSQMNSARKPEKVQVRYSSDFSIMSGVLLAIHIFCYCSVLLNYKMSKFSHLTALMTFNYSL